MGQDRGVKILHSGKYRGGGGGAIGVIGSFSYMYQAKMRWYDVPC